MSDYPEHEKMRAISDQSQAIGEFLEWLPAGADLHLCEKITKVDCRNGGSLRLDGTRRRVYYSCVNGTLVKDDGEVVGECDECDGTGFVDRIEPLYLPSYLDITKLLAKFFDIDLGKIEEEKRAMLEALRATTS